MLGKGLGFPHCLKNCSMSQCYLNLKRAVDSSLSAIIKEYDTCLHVCWKRKYLSPCGSDEDFIRDVIADLGIKACICVCWTHKLRKSRGNRIGKVTRQ